MKCVYILALFLAIVHGGAEDFRKIDSIRQESPCRKAGGRCVVSADCPEGRQTKKLGLCPEQQDEGIECCYGMSVKETRCSMNGGICIPKTEVCGESVRYREATDCPETDNCCILVH